MADKKKKVFIPLIAAIGFDLLSGLDKLSVKLSYISIFMRKVIVCLFFGILLSCSRMTAQSPVVQMLEGEFRAGLTTPLGGYHTGKAEISGTLGIEGRYNIKGTPWDCGLMLDLSTARRGFEHLYNDGNDRWQNNRTLALALVGDYNLRQGAKFNPFAGLALGVGINDVVGDKYFPSKGTSLYAAQRVGIEFLYHIRVCAQFNLCRSGYNNLGLTLGFVFGGRPKK